MQQQEYLFEYAIVRVVPQVEREEFLNVGVVLYCAKQRFLNARFHLDQRKLSVFACEFSVEELQVYFDGFVDICAGKISGGPIGRLSQAERFRWLTATRSTVLQTSKVHPGLCYDSSDMLTRIFLQLVM